MDEYYNVKRLALVLAVQAEIEGMKAENMQRQYLNEPMAHKALDFECKAFTLTNLAYAHNEQL